MKFAFIIALLVLACNPMRKLEKNIILKRMAALESFAGKYIETGVAPAAQETQIIARMNPVAVLSQNNLGTLHYAQGILSVYYPKSGFGFRYRNAPELTGQDQMRWLESEYDWHVANYDIKQTSDSKIANHETKGVDYSPNATFAASPFSYHWHADVEPNFAFALQTVMTKDNKELYRICFTDIEFQKTTTDAMLAFKFPGGATVAEYDLASKNYTFAAAKQSANFSLSAPAESPLFSLKKIIRVQGLIPAFTFYFENLPYQTYYTQVKDYALPLVPERGLVLTGKTGRKYRINFAGAFRSVYFLERGTHHAIVSSRPLSEIMAWLENSR